MTGEQQAASTPTKHEAHVRYTADAYDTYTAQFVSRFDDVLAERVLEEAIPRMPGATLLDVGTGTARILVHLARMRNLSGLRLVGSDVFEDMIRRAEQTVAEAGFADRIELRIDDVHTMQLPDGFADIVISRSTIHHWKDPRKALREIFRVLKPGGIAMIHDVRRDPAPEAIEEFNRLRAEAGIGPSFLDEKFTAAEVRGMLADAGLADYAQVYRPERGLMALGFAVEMHKPAAISHQIPDAIA